MLRRNCNSLVLLVVGITLLGCLNVNARTELLEAQTALLRYQLDQATRANAVFPLVPTEATQRNVQQLLVQRHVKQHQPTAKSKTSMKTFKNRITLNLDGDAEVNVKGFIAPIEYTQYNFHVKWDELANFRVAEPEKQYPASVFQSFLPPEPVTVGECWQIDEAGARELLKQLHPNPSFNLHINVGDSYGLWACLRAYNDKFTEILFRIHAEFVLDNGWFTPSQFAGHLVIDRIREKVMSFNMYVPEATLNFDAGWKAPAHPGGAAEIGYCPRMELCTDTKPQNIEFATAITQEEAERALSSRFYKFQQIDWVSLEEALELAPAHGKPIHVISVDGPLFDEAC